MGLLDTVDNADVTMLILSNGLMAEDENGATFFAKSRSREGKIHHLPTGEELMFDKTYGVFFLMSLQTMRKLQTREG